MIRSATTVRLGRTSQTAPTPSSALWRCCLAVGVDPVGIPCWSPGGRVQGLSSRTTGVHLSWMICDLVDRMPFDDTEIHRVLWQARLCSISASPNVASVMAGVRDERTEDEFEAFRAEDGFASHAG